MLTLYNTLKNKVEEFKPIDSNNVKMYVCGPTVYDRAHIGNARPAVVFDVLFRLLQFLYPKVTYVRNITDIDDKIYKRSKELGISVYDLTNKTTTMYFNDMATLNVLPPTISPKATDHINDMIDFITEIINKGYAYFCNNHVYFNTSVFDQYGVLSNKKINDLKNGIRIDVSDNKKNSTDFVLWKPIDDAFSFGWDSPWGTGRPGWHIECSTMAQKYLGSQFDLHGGGCDLIFPHHENEIAQSYAINNKVMANYWIHNGHLVVNGEKMSKSLGNFFTVSELLEKFNGETIRLALLMTHYKKPLDFSIQLLQQAKSILCNWYKNLFKSEITHTDEVDQDILNALFNDINTPQAISVISQKIKTTTNLNVVINNCRRFLGILTYSECINNVDINWVNEQIELRSQAKRDKNYQLADLIRDELKQCGIELEDDKDKTSWKYTNKNL